MIWDWERRPGYWCLQVTILGTPFGITWCEHHIPALRAGRDSGHLFCDVGRLMLWAFP